MTLVKYPQYNLVSSPFGSLFDRAFSNNVSNRVSRFRPDVDVFENDKSYEIQVSVPGMNKDDFKLDIKEGLLTISGERKFDKNTEEKNYHSVETQFGSFVRSFNLPDHVDASKIAAEYNNGILEIVVPKDVKKTLASTIKVK